MLSLLGQALRRSTSRLTVSIWAIATVTVSLAGPFGMFAFLPLLPALAYWAIVIGLSILIANTVKVFAHALLAHWPGRRVDLLVPLLFALVFTPLLHPVGRLFAGQEAVGLLSFRQSLVIVLVVAYAVMLLQWIVYTSRPPVEVPAQTRAMARPRLLDRVEAAPDAQVMRVTVEDHYVLLHLDDGTIHRLLMRFADAVAELAGVEGFLTHRSHWVADGAVIRVERAGGREMALLVDGVRVPVSRTHRDNLVRRGLLPDRPVPGDAASAE